MFKSSKFEKRKTVTKRNILNHASKRKKQQHQQQQKRND
jgi:hypothetical protein